MILKNQNKTTLNIFLFSGSTIITIALSIFLMFNFLQTYSNVSDLDKNIATNFVFAQVNHPEKSNFSIIGNVIIPTNSNGTMTTAVNNSSKNINNTFIDKIGVAQNFTTGVNILKEPHTFPISPTGVSTEGLQQPPEHRLINTSDIKLTQ